MHCHNFCYSSTIEHFGMLQSLAAQLYQTVPAGLDASPYLRRSHQSPCVPGKQVAAHKLLLGSTGQLCLLGLPCLHGLRTILKLIVRHFLKFQGPKRACCSLAGERRPAQAAAGQVHGGERGGAAVPDRGAGPAAAALPRRARGHAARDERPGHAAPAQHRCAHSA